MKQRSETIIQALNPADYFTLAMDEEIRKEGMPGSLCGIALRLDGHPEIHKLGERIDRFCENFPSARASLRKIGRRFYWCKRDNPENIFFLHDLPETQDQKDPFHASIVGVLNRPNAREAVNPLEFHLFQGDPDSILLIRWIHPFCDAIGAGLIVRYLATEPASPEKAFRIGPVSLWNQQLNRFNLWHKFQLLRKAKMLIEDIDQYRSILPNRERVPPQRLNFRNFELTPEQSRNIAEIGRREVGLIGASLYPIGCLMRAIDKMSTPSAGEAYCVPYAFNLRPQKALSPVTGNHVSALFARAPLEVVQSRERLFRHLTDQYQATIRGQFDYAFLPLMWLAQWLSLERYGKTLRQSYNGGHERSSFWFSDTGRSDLARQKIFGAAIRGLIPLTQISTPPGLALLTGIFENRLSLTYNFVEPLFDTDWIGRLHHEVLVELLGGHT